MNKTAVVKFAARLVVGAGTTTISNSIIKNNVEPRNLIENISVGVASAVIGSMASEATRRHTDTQIDAVVNAWKTTRSDNTENTTVVTD